MEKQETIKKLNKHDNFHLTLKIIQITDNLLIKEVISKISKKSVVIDNQNNIYNQLKEAYETRVEYVFIDEKIDYLLPIYICITKEAFDIIKPIVPVFYVLKDNKQKEKIKTICRKKMTTWQEYKTTQEMLDELINILNK